MLLNGKNKVIGAAFTQLMTLGVWEEEVGGDTNRSSTLLCFYLLIINL